MASSRDGDKGAVIMTGGNVEDNGVDIELTDAEMTPRIMVKMLTKAMRSGFGQINGRLDRVNGTVGDLCTWRSEVSNRHLIEDHDRKAAQGNPATNNLEIAKEQLKAWSGAIGGITAILLAIALFIQNVLPGLIK